MKKPSAEPAPLDMKIDVSEALNVLASAGFSSVDFIQSELTLLEFWEEKYQVKKCQQNLTNLKQIQVLESIWKFVMFYLKKPDTTPKKFMKNM